jgi:hypothetical protein
MSATFRPAWLLVHSFSMFAPSLHCAFYCVLIFSTPLRISTMTDTTPTMLTLSTPEELAQAQLDRMEKAIGSLQPLLNLLEKPVNGEEENLIKLLFQRLDTVIAGQDALQIQVSNLDQLVRDVMGEDD